jgi:hypothetical protein
VSKTDASRPACSADAPDHPERTRAGGGRCYRAFEMSGEPETMMAERPRPAHLRLIWSNPCQPAPRKPVDLAAAIEHHLSGRDGLTDEEFLRVYSRRNDPRPAWAEAAAIV